MSNNTAFSKRVLHHEIYRDISNTLQRMHHNRDNGTDYLPFNELIQLRLHIEQAFHLINASINDVNYGNNNIVAIDKKVIIDSLKDFRKYLEYHYHILVPLNKRAYDKFKQNSGYSKQLIQNPRTLRSSVGL